MKRISRLNASHRGLLLAASASLLLAACGGAGDGANTAPAAEPVVLTETTIEMPAESVPASAADQLAQPAFHVAPVLLDEPDDRDVLDNSASALIRPHAQYVPMAQAAMSSRHLTVESLLTARRMQERSVQPLNADGSVTPMASSTAVSTYTPAQIRAAYGLPALPAAGTALTAAQAAQLGAGQTIYIVDAYHDPNVIAELNAFNQKFGLPTCSSRTLTTSTALPLPAPAATDGCALVLAYSTTSGTLTNAAPAFDSGWATEITLDVQWAHATAPLARIVLIEAPDPSLNSLVGAVRLANTMGPGVVSMSFGATEGSWTSSVDSAFTGAGMTYLAATGDSGAAVSWPAVSTNVVAVGGTSLTYTGSGSRTEIAWSGTGGGVSAYVPTPLYQASAVPGVGSLPRRGVADVAFNADPSTGQFVAVIPPGSATVNWISAGGTSLSTPQWAGVLAVANALRLQNGKALVGAPHASLYGQIGANPGTYAAVFADVAQGSHGTCSSCFARTGYDQLTGLGTPNVSSLLSTLAGAAAVAQAPVVSPASISGKVGTPLSFSVTVTATNPVTYTLSGAPAGMTISTAGVVSWASPVLGSYAVTVVAKDSKTALSGQGVYTIKIEAPLPPVVTAATVNGMVGTPLSYSVAVTASNPVTYALSGAPAGMGISSTGVVSWASPVLGSYSVTVSAKDSKTALVGQGVLSVKIAAQPAPTLPSGAISGKAGTALSFSAAATASNPVTYTLTGAPAGMAISASGVVSWANPIVGSYAVTVTAKDSKTGLSGKGVFTVTIASAPAGPTISAPALTGVAGKPLTGTITVSNPAGSAMSITITGVPLGISFALSGQSIVLNWAKPVTGSYLLNITVKDAAGRTAQTSMPITIAAK